MSEVYEVDPARPEAAGSAIDAAADAIAAGLLVLFPTETVYGIATRPDDHAATARLFEAKRRPPDLNLPVLAANASEAFGVASATGPAERLAASFWPGPLTMVLRRTGRSSPWALGRRPDTIGVRVPDHALSGLLLARSGPLAATSANLSGHPPVEDPEALLATFGQGVAVYVVVAAGSKQPKGTPSTVVDLTGERIRILREEGIDRVHLMAAMAESGRAVDSLD
ncbi:MAG: L-threonylcarbamoyladenylate synthase [Actinomycetota bacterium]